MKAIIMKSTENKEQHCSAETSTHNLHCFEKRTTNSSCMFQYFCEIKLGKADLKITCDKLQNCHGYQSGRLADLVQEHVDKCEDTRQHQGEQSQNSHSLGTLEPTCKEQSHWISPLLVKVYDSFFLKNVLFPRMHHCFKNKKKSSCPFILFSLQRPCLSAGDSAPRDLGLPALGTWPTDIAYIAKVSPSMNATQL